MKIKIDKWKFQRIMIDAYKTIAIFLVPTIYIERNWRKWNKWFNICGHFLLWRIQLTIRFKKVTK